MSLSLGIALFCLLHPATVEKRNRIINLLQTCYDYRDPAAQTTTWCYLTPSCRPQAANQLVKSRMGGRTATAIAGIEVYANKAALTRQLEHPEFKRYHDTAVAEELYAQPEDMSAWYPCAGYLARDKTAPGGSIVVTAMFFLRAGEESKQGALAILREYADWVQSNEPDVLTYCVMTRPKASMEILLFERYVNVEALMSHGSTREFKTMLQMKPLITEVAMNEWNELDGSFVGKIVSGDEQNENIGHASKL